MDISVVIVNYNSYSLLKDCIRSIEEYSKDLDYEIIVVDNNSPQRDIEEVESTFTNVRLIQHTKNAGFGIANNLGAKVAKGEFLFFLNPDTVFLNNAMLYFLNFLQQTKQKVGAVGSVLLSKDLTANASYSESFISYYKDVLAGVLNVLFESSSKPNQFISGPSKEVAWVSGADLFIRKSVFEQIGGFDENFFMYYEENDLQRRLFNAGFKNYIVNGPRIIHLEGGGVAKISLNKKRVIDTSKFYYYKKYTSSIEFFVISKIYQYLTYIKIKKEYNREEANKYNQFIHKHI